MSSQLLASFNTLTVHQKEGSVETTYYTDEILSYIFLFVGKNQYRYIAPVSQQFYRLYCRILLPVAGEKVTVMNFITEQRALICVNEMNRSQLMAMELKVCCIAAKYGYLSVMQFMYTINENTLQWYDTPLKYIVKHDHLHILHWIAELVLLNEISVDIVSHLCSYAVEFRRLHILQWAGITFSNNSTCSTDCQQWYDDECSKLARHGKLNDLVWMLQSQDIFDLNSTSIYIEAAQGGHVSIIKWLYSHGYFPRYNESDEVEILSVAVARYGHVDILQWLLTNGFPWDVRTYSTAATRGHLHILQWLHSNGYILSIEDRSKTICAKAARSGHLHVVKWLHNNGFPWDERTCYMAACSGHLSILKWARENDCPWNIQQVRKVSFKYPCIVEWLAEITESSL